MASFLTYEINDLLGMIKLLPSFDDDEMEENEVNFDVPTKDLKRARVYFRHIVLINL
jgi:hypothetical protein